MDRHSQRGSAIIMLFIAIALFGMLGYAFLQGSRGSTNIVTGEAAKAKTTESKMCDNAYSMALKRLEAKGCGSFISSASDGSNTISGAPTDGACSIFHPNGGGIKPCNNYASAPADPCLTGAIGTTCTADGAIYIGSVGADRIYARASDTSTGIIFSSGSAAIAVNFTNGLTTTNTLISAPPGGFSYPAAQACRGLGPTWYVPARDELTLIWTNRATLNLATMGIDTTGTWISYWTSSQWSNSAMYIKNFSNGNDYGDPKGNTQKLRCVRRD